MQLKGHSLLVVVWTGIIFSCAACNVFAQVAARDIVPSGYTPGQALQVRIAVNPGISTKAWALEDIPPADWTVSNISSGGFLDTLNKKVKWGLFYTTGTVTLTYTLTPPVGAQGAKTFSGAISQNGASQTITGKTQITAAIWVDFAYMGNEAGSYLQPFNTLPEALSIVPVGGTIRTKKGSSALSLRITKAVRLEAVGGTVRLGMKNLTASAQITKKNGTVPVELVTFCVD